LHKVYGTALTQQNFSVRQAAPNASHPSRVRLAAPERLNSSKKLFRSMDKQQAEAPRSQMQVAALKEKI
jgi:hypothetical protein